MTPTPSDAQPVAQAIDRAIERLRDLHPYAGHSAWDDVVREELQSLFDAERQKREAAEREAEFWKDHCENVVGKWCTTHKARAESAEASLAKANARIAESDWQPVETLPKDGRSVMVWLAATATERPHAFAPVSVCEDGSWWDDSTGDQIEPLSAVYWKAIQPPNALSNIEKERDDGR